MKEGTDFFEEDGVLGNSVLQRTVCGQSRVHSAYLRGSGRTIYRTYKNIRGDPRDYHEQQNRGFSCDVSPGSKTRSVLLKTRSLQTDRQTDR